MDKQNFISKLTGELKEATLLGRISFVANLFTIVGISLFVILIKPLFTVISNHEINATNFFGFGGSLLFWVLVFFAILAGYTYTKQFFQKLKSGLVFYYGLIVVYFFFGFAMLSSLGVELIELMIKG